MSFQAEREIRGSFLVPDSLDGSQPSRTVPARGEAIDAPKSTDFALRLK
jgi:hypothetical protein